MATGDQDVPRLVVTEQAEQAGRVLGLSQPELPIGHSATALAALTDQFSRAPVTPLLTAAEALPVAAELGVVGISAPDTPRGWEPRSWGRAKRPRMSSDWYRGLTGAALGSLIPRVGTAVRAGVGSSCHRCVLPVNPLEGDNT